MMKFTLLIIVLSTISQIQNIFCAVFKDVLHQDFEAMLLNYVMQNNDEIRKFNEDFARDCENANKEGLQARAKEVKDILILNGLEKDIGFFMNTGVYALTSHYCHNNDEKKYMEENMPICRSMNIKCEAVDSHKKPCVFQNVLVFYVSGFSYKRWIITLPVPNGYLFFDYDGELTINGENGRGFPVGFAGVETGNIYTLKTFLDDLGNILNHKKKYIRIEPSKTEMAEFYKELGLSKSSVSFIQRANANEEFLIDIRNQRELAKKELIISIANAPKNMTENRNIAPESQQASTSKSTQSSSRSKAKITKQPELHGPLERKFPNKDQLMVSKAAALENSTEKETHMLETQRGSTSQFMQSSSGDAEEWFLHIKGI